MATSDKFIQSMLELLDKLIEHQGKNATLLSEIKSSINELRNESENIIDNLREKLPSTIQDEQENVVDKISVLSEKFDNGNKKLAETIEEFLQNNNELEKTIEENTKILKANSAILVDIKDSISYRKEDQDRTRLQIENISSFIDAIKSKRMWIAVIIGAITALATAFSSISNAWNNIQANKTQVVIDNQN